MPRSCILARFSTWDTVLMICKGLPTYQFLIPWWLVGHKRHSLGSWTGWREVLAMNSDHHSINKNIKICTEPKDEKIDPSACYCKTSMPHFGLGTKLSSTYFIGSYNTEKMMPETLTVQTKAKGQSLCSQGREEWVTTFRESLLWKLDNIIFIYVHLTPHPSQHISSHYICVIIIKSHFAPL